MDKDGYRIEREDGIGGPIPIGHPENVIGGDQRVAVEDATAYPWRCVCWLEIETQDELRFLGTGWLAGPRTIITAGHCVYFHAHGGWAKRISVIPGRNGSMIPFNSFASSDLRSVAGWIQTQDETYDYGAIILPEAQPIGALLGTLGWADLSDVQLAQRDLILPGYPSDKPVASLWYGLSRVMEVGVASLVYPIDTAGGQSGAPLLWVADDQVPYVVGIHRTGDMNGNVATRINASVFEAIASWVDAPG
jgi:V8-like Glu-specific endopeptidase